MQNSSQVDIAQGHSQWQGKDINRHLGAKHMRKRIRFTTSILAVLLSLAFIGSSDGSQSFTHSSSVPGPKDRSQKDGSVVYVCACLKTKSCSCMTEAKMEGPCACGTQGGPPLKPVPSDSDWAKENREALAK